MYLTYLLLIRPIAVYIGYKLYGTEAAARYDSSFFISQGKALDPTTFTGLWALKLSKYGFSYSAYRQAFKYLSDNHGLLKMDMVGNSLISRKLSTQLLMSNLDILQKLLINGMVSQYLPQMKYQVELLFRIKTQVDAGINLLVDRHLY